jgi:hypothetical protein
MAEAGKKLPKAQKKKAAGERELLLQETRTLLNLWMRIREFLLLACIPQKAAKRR